MPSPPLGDLPNPGMEPRSPALEADSLLTEPPGKLTHFLGLYFSFSGWYAKETREKDHDTAGILVTRKNREKS